MTLSALGIFSAAGAGGVGDYELIQTQILGSSQASVVFSNLGNFSSTYKHLQLRFTARNTTASNSNEIIISRLNGDSGSNYNSHYLVGTGSSVLSGPFTGLTGALTGGAFEANNTANSFFVSVVDLLDPYSTTKNKTFRTLNGGLSSTITRIDLHSSAWRNTNSVTSWEVLANAGSLAIGSRFSLYGIKG
jgi:hypothetical protein